MLFFCRSVAASKAVLLTALPLLLLPWLFLNRAKLLDICRRPWAMLSFDLIRAGAKDVASNTNGSLVPSSSSLS